jgi:hypothetical protein
MSLDSMDMDMDESWVEGAHGRVKKPENSASGNKAPTGHYAISTVTLGPKETPVNSLTGLTNYERNIKGVTVDVYDVLKGFNISCPAMQHAIKKMLFAGLRGAKDFNRDADEAILSIKRSKELNK